MWPHALHAQLFAKTMRWHQIERKKKKKDRKTAGQALVSSAFFRVPIVLEKCYELPFPLIPLQNGGTLLKCGKVKKHGGRGTISELKH